MESMDLVKLDLVKLKDRYMPDHRHCLSSVDNVTAGNNITIVVLGNLDSGLLAGRMAHHAVAYIKGNMSAIINDISGLKVADADLPARARLLSGCAGKVDAISLEYLLQET